VFRTSFRQVHNTFKSGLNDYGQIRGASTGAGCNGTNGNGPSDSYTTADLLGGVDPNNCGGRHRPRHMTFYGIEPRLDLQHNAFGIQSDLVVGMRLHWEDIKREQYGVNGAPHSLSYAKGPNGSLREKILHDVEAQSYYAQNTFYVDNWSITPGLRVERYKIKYNIGVVDGATVSSDAGIDDQGVQDGAGLKYSVSQTKVLPGFGLAWNGLKNTTIFGGVHRGFSPARPDRDIGVDSVEKFMFPNKTKAEVSTNYELGMRSNYFKGINVESTLFHTVIDDMIVGIQDGAYRNAGKASMTGLELGGRVDFGTIYNTAHNFYLTGSWTGLFNGKFKDDGVFLRTEDNAIGNFQSGDRLPYAPRNIASLNFGYSHPIGVNVQVGADHVSEQKPTPNEYGLLTGHSGNIPSYTLLNASASYKPVGYKTTFFVSGHNLNDKEYLSSRVDGMHVGRGRMIFGGVTYDF
jgi:Fe(3+) dicitrate transport protein